MSRVCAQRLGNLGGAIALEVAQGQDVALALWEQTEKMLHTHLCPLAGEFYAVAGEKLLFQTAQRTRLVPISLLPVVHNRRAGRRVKPTARAFLALIFPEPAQRLEKYCAGEILGQRSIANLARNRAL